MPKIIGLGNVSIEPSEFVSVLTVYYKNGHEVKTPSKRPYIERLALLDPFKYHDAIPLSEVGKYLG